MSLLLSALLSFGLFAKDDGFVVHRLTPQGETKDVKQIRIEFNQAAVRFGNPREPAPATSDCFKNGAGRWIDPTNWVYDFEKALPGGLRCGIKMRTDLKSVAGKAFSAKTEFFLTTGGPSVIQTQPESWVQIDEAQNFILVLDAEAKPESVREKAFFTVEGLGDRLPVEVLGASEADKVLRAFQRSSGWAARELFSIKDGKLIPLQPLMVIRTKRQFPGGGRVSFSWASGIQSASGVPVKDEQVFEFNVREPFKVTFSCEREGTGKPCIPILPMNLNFTANVKNKFLMDSYLVDAKGKKYKLDFSDRHPENSSTWFSFAGPFDPSSKYTVHLPKGIRDETDRPLTNEDKFPLETATGENPPLLKFAADFGVIEAGPGAALPVTIRDIEAKIPTVLQKQPIFPLMGKAQKIESKNFLKIIETLQGIRTSPYGETSMIPAGVAKTNLEIKKPLKEQEFEVVGIPLPKVGFYFVEMKSPRLGKSLLQEDRAFYVRSAALVTNLSVHLKVASKEAFVWVTNLKTSQPVAGADVRLFDCKGQSIAAGKSATDGTLRLVLPVEHSKLASCTEYLGPEAFATASKGEDFSFTSSNWDRGIESWRFRVNTGESEPVHAHTILDRNLLRPNETISMKHVLRRGTKFGFGLLGADVLPKKITIEHESGLQTYDINLKWNPKMGTSESQWKIPAGAKLGRWSIIMNFQDGRTETAGFRIENYKIPLLKGHLKWPDQDLVGVQKVPVHVGVEYLAGGGAGDLDLRYRWSSDTGHFSPSDDELSEFRFLNGGVKEGLVRTADEEESEAPEGSELKGQGQLRLNASGTGSFDVKGLKRLPTVQDLRIETEYRDPNGDVQTVSSKATIWPTSQIVGISARGWGQTKEKAAFEAVVLDLKEKPVAGVEVEINLFQTQTISHRKRLVGGFFGYENFNDVKKLGRLCRGKTDGRGRLTCQGPVKEVGTIQAVARLKDPAGRISEAQTTQWIVDNEERLWFGGGDADRIDLLPSKKDFQPGETAEFQLQMPFPQAKVLVTVEREGVIEHRILDVDAKNPVIRLPVKDSWSPNVFVSALVLRGRVDNVKPTALLDLGKPAYKLGLTEIRVGWQKHELKVKVETDAKVYPVRGRAKAQIAVTDSAGKPVKGEISVAVVDEGLLQLLPNNTWKLLEKMMDPRPLLVRTSTLQTQVIGKRHFGLKALAAGGDGGRANLRELFDTLLLWKGTLALDSSGKASIDIPINDSLTNFRVVAIALNGQDQFGTGSANFRTSQDLMIFAGAPAIVREGDRLRLGYTIRNVSNAAKDLTLSLESQPAVNAAAQSLKLAPGESKEISWMVNAPVGISDWSLTMAANEGSKSLDRLRSRLQVLPVWMTTVRQGSLMAVTKNAQMPLAPSLDAVPGSASLQIELLNGLASGRAGLVDFWKNYSYTCLEQRISRVVTLNDLDGWKKIEAELDSYTDESGRLKLFPGPGQGSVVLNTYVLSIAKEAGFRFNAEKEKQLLDAVEKFAENQSREIERVSFADEGLRRVSAMDTLSRYGRFKTSQLSYLKVTPNLWPTSTVVEWFQLVRRETKLPNREKLLPESENILRARMIFTGAKFSFSDEKTDQFWWLFRGSAVPTAQLILATANDPAWKNDLPKVLRGFVQKQKNGSWELTTENAWGRLALDRYKAIFENVKVTGTSTAQTSDAKASWDWSKGPRGDLELSAPTKKDNLRFNHVGAGQPWALVRLKAAVPLKEAISSGFFVTKKVEGLQVQEKGKWHRGDIVKVQLKIKATADAGWVVLNEPLPPGAVVLGSGLGNDSQIMNEKRVESLWPSFEERRSDSLRLYYAWVPQGEHDVEYRLRLNQGGGFQMPATRVEAMYDPDVFAEIPNEDWNVLAK